MAVYEAPGIHGRMSVFFDASRPSFGLFMPVLVQGAVSEGGQKPSTGIQILVLFSAGAISQGDQTLLRDSDTSFDVGGGVQSRGQPSNRGIDILVIV